MFGGVTRTCRHPSEACLADPSASSLGIGLQMNSLNDWT